MQEEYCVQRNEESICEFGVKKWTRVNFKFESSRSLTASEMYYICSYLTAALKNTFSFCKQARTDLRNLVNIGSDKAKH